MHRSNSVLLRQFIVTTVLLASLVATATPVSATTPLTGDGLIAYPRNSSPLLWGTNPADTATVTSTSTAGGNISSLIPGADDIRYPTVDAAGNVYFYRAKGVASTDGFYKSVLNGNGTYETPTQLISFTAIGTKCSSVSASCTYVNWMASSVSPDGNWLLFSSGVPNPQSTAYGFVSYMLLLKLSDLSIQRVFSDPLPATPSPNNAILSAWNRAGTQIAYTRRASVNATNLTSVGGVYTRSFDASTGTLGAEIQQTSDTDYQGYNHSGIAFSPDGSYLLYGDQAPANNVIKRVVIRTSESAALNSPTTFMTLPGLSVGSPGFSPSGDYVKFTVNINGNDFPGGSGDIWIANADGTAPRLLRYAAPGTCGGQDALSSLWLPSASDLLSGALTPVTYTPPAIQFQAASYSFRRSTAVNESITSTGGFPQYWTVSPSLPSGLAIGCSGSIIGTPTTVTGTQLYTVTGILGTDSSTTSAQITITDKPATVGTVTTEPGNAQVNLFWTAPLSNGSPITDYVIEYKLDTATTWSTFVDGTGTATTSSVTGLTNGSLYNFRVSAVNSVDTGTASAVVKQIPGVPLQVVGLSLTSGNAQLTATWTAPAANGYAISSYVVQYSTSSGGTYTTVSRSDALALTETITGLTNNTTYYVKVTAVNANGSGLASAISNIKVGLAAAPTSLSIDTYTATSVKVSWTAPTQAGSGVTGYKAYYKASTSTTWSTGTSVGLVTTYNFTTGLTAGTAYNFRVVAMTAAGDGSFSESITATPRAVPSAPSAPGRIATAGEMALTWSTPSGNGSSITDYTIRYKKTSDSAWTEIPKGSATTGYTVSGLLASTSYDFSVRAVNGEGAGPWSTSGTTTSGTAPTITAMTYVSGPTGVGGTYRVTGTNFSAGTTLTINGVVETITARTATTLTFLLPAGTGTVPLIANTGGLASSAYNYTYLPTITAITPQGAVYNSGAQVTLTGTGFTNAATVKFGATSAGGFLFDSATQVRVTLPTGTARSTATVTVTTSAGTSLGFNYAYDSPTLTAISPSSGTTAGGTTITLRGTNFTNTSTVAFSGVAATSVTFIAAETLTAVSPIGSGTANVTVTRNGLTTAAQVFTYTGPPLQAVIDTLTAGSSQVSLQWSAPVNGGSAITGYDVEFRALNSSTWDNSNAVSSSPTADTVTVTGLTNAITYEFRIRAKNSNGDGPWSETRTAIPATVPDNMTAPALTAGNTSIGLTWAAPGNGGSSISGYDVQYRSVSSGSWIDWTLESMTASSTGSIVTGLTNGDAYEFRVRARNAVGTAASWSPTAFGTPQAVPLQVTGVTTVEGAAQVELRWTAPGDGGSPLTGYDIQYRVGSGVWTDWTGVASNPSAVTDIVTSLMNGTAYEFQVRAKNSDGNGLWSIPVTATPRTIPAQISQATATPSDSQVLLAWSAPANSGSAITGYDLRYRESGATTWITISLASTVLSETLTGLSNGTVYEFQVRALNALGDGDWSTTTTAAAGVPAPPSSASSSGGTASFAVQTPTVTLSPATVVRGGRYQITASITCASTIAMSSGRFPPTMYYSGATQPPISGVYGTAVINGASATWTVTAVAPMIEGIYKVRVYGRDNPTGVRCTGSTSTFAWSTEATLTVARDSVAPTPTSDTRTAVLTVPDQVVGLTSRQTGSTIALSWSATSGAIEYLVEYSVAGGAWIAFAGGSAVGSTRSGTVPVNSGTVSFRVSAINGAGTGPASSPSTLTLAGSSTATQARAVPTMTISTLNARAGQDITLTARVTCPSGMAATAGAWWPSMSYIVWSSPYINDAFIAHPTLSADGRTATWTVTVPGPTKAGRYRVQAYGRDNPQGVTCTGDTYQFIYSPSDLWMMVTGAADGTTSSSGTATADTQTATSQPVTTAVQLGGPVVTGANASQITGVISGVTAVASSERPRSITVTIPSIDSETVAVADEFLGNIPGVTDVIVEIGGKLTITLEPGYSGVLSLPIVRSTRTEAPIRTTLQVAVAPERVSSATISKIQRSRSTITWTKPAGSSLTYKVVVNGRTACTTTALTCSVPELLGPTSVVTVTAVDASQVGSLPTTAKVSTSGAITVGKVTFKRSSSVLTAAAKPFLRQLAADLKSAGYKSVRVVGYSSDDRSVSAAKRLSITRAKVVASQLRKFAPWLKIAIVGRGASTLINANLTEAQRQANRRAEVQFQLG